MRFLRKYKWPLILAAIAVFLFYWYEVRPMYVYRSCVVQSSVDARKLLKSKADIGKGTPEGATYQQLLDKNMYLHTDYQSFLQKCLLYYGITPPLDPKAGPAVPAVSSSSVSSVSKAAVKASSSAAAKPTVKRTTTKPR